LKNVLCALFRREGTSMYQPRAYTLPGHTRPHVTPVPCSVQGSPTKTIPSIPIPRPKVSHLDACPPRIMCVRRGRRFGHHVGIRIGCVCGSLRGSLWVRTLCPLPPPVGIGVPHFLTGIRPCSRKKVESEKEQSALRERGFSKASAEPERGLSSAVQVITGGGTVLARMEDALVGRHWRIWDSTE
jgi:hypothetical protein